MNILIANTQEFNPMIGGVERISDTMAREFFARGHRVWFAACLRSAYSEPYQPAAPQRILPLEEYETEENLQSLCDYIRENEIALLHNQAGNIPPFTRLCSKAAKLTGIPLVSVAHIAPWNQVSSLRDFRFSKVFPGERLKALSRMLLYPLRIGKLRKSVENTYEEVLTVSDATVTLSPAYIPQIQYLKPDAYITAIPNFLPLKRQPMPEGKKKTVLFVGRLDFTHKRPDRLLDIWQRICHRYPDWTLKIAGDGPAGGALRNYVEKKQIPRVEFLGFCDPKAYYQEAQIICQTSTIEGLSMVLLEGMAYGCVPVVYDSYEAVYDIITSWENGVIVKAFRRKDFINALTKLMDDSSLCRTLGEEGVKIPENFQKEQIIEAWLTLYRRCLEEK